MSNNQNWMWKNSVPVRNMTHTQNHRLHRQSVFTGSNRFLKSTNREQAETMARQMGKPIYRLSSKGSTKTKNYYAATVIDPLTDQPKHYLLFTQLSSPSLVFDGQTGKIVGDSIKMIDKHLGYNANNNPTSLNTSGGKRKTIRRKHRKNRTRKN
jgi:hypothetical protein